MIFMDVDTAVEVIVNAVPLTDDTDFKTRETAVAYNATGMDLVWNFITPDGTITQTAVTPTTGGDYDWSHVGDGSYKIEIPASGGASINNDTEGYGWFSGVCDGVLPWVSHVYGFRAASINDALVEGGDNLDVNTVQVSGDSTAADNLEAMYDGTGYTDATAPASRSQVGGLDFSGASVNVSPLAAPNGFVLTTGSEANDEDDVIALDGTRHELSDDGGTLDAYYIFDIEDGVPLSVTFTGVYQGGNDDFDIFVNTGSSGTPSWSQRGTLEGTSSGQNVTHTFTLFTGDTLTDDPSRVWVRIQATGLTSPSFDTDQVYMAKAILGRSPGYTGGFVYFDSGASNTNVEPYVDGTADNPVSSWTAVKSIISSVGLTKVDVTGSLTLDATAEGIVLMMGNRASLALGSQDIGGVEFVNFKDITGTGTQSNGERAVFTRCTLGRASGVTVPQCFADFCEIGASDVTLGESGEYDFDNCSSGVAGTSAAVIDMNSVGSTELGLTNYARGITVSGISADDTITIHGILHTVTVNGSASATIQLGGTHGAIAGTASAAVTQANSFDCGDIAEILTDTGTTIPDLIGTPSDLGGGSDLATNLSDMAGSGFDDSTDSLEAIRGEIAGTNPNVLLTAEVATVNTQTEFTLATGSDVDDSYNDQTIVLYDDSNSDYPSVRVISDYVGSTKTVTIDSAPDFTLGNDDSVRIFATAPGTTAPTAAAIADAVFDEVASGHTTVGTFGALVNDTYNNADELNNTKVFEVLNLTASGNIGIDWANVENATSTVGLTNTTVGTVTTNSDMRGTDSAATATALATVDENVDTLITQLTTDVSEPGVPGATATVPEMLATLYGALRNRIDVTSSAKTFYNDAGSAVWSKSLSDNGTTYTEAEGS